MLTRWRQSRLRHVGAALWALWLAAAAGCVFHPTLPTEPREQPSAAAPPSVPEARPEPAGPTPPPAAVPAPEAPPPVDPIERRPEVIVLFDRTVAAHVAVAQRLEEELSTELYRVRAVSLDAVEGLGDAGGSATEMGAAGMAPERYAVAVGLEAALFASTHLHGPTVFCQVFNYGPLLEGEPRAWGVASVPPLELQLLAWKRLDPTLARVGLIVSEDHEELVREAREAGQRTGVAVAYQYSSSDRQTLYHFRRLAREVDGIWLLPDNRILSPSVISDVLDEALARGLQVAAVNAPALARGVLLSASATPGDVAETASQVLAQVIRNSAALSPLTGLSEVAIEVDLEMATRLGLEPHRASWSLSWHSAASTPHAQRTGAVEDAR